MITANSWKRRLMRSAAGLAVAVVAVLLLAVGAWAALAPGGNEPEAVRSVELTMLALGTLAGIGAAMAAGAWASVLG